MIQTDVLNKSPSLLVIFSCCLHSDDHIRLIYENRVLHSSIILAFTVFFLTPFPYSDPPAYWLPLMFSTPLHILAPQAIRLLRVSKLAAGFRLIESRRIDRFNEIQWIWYICDCISLERCRKCQLCESIRENFHGKTQYSSCPRLYPFDL